MRQALLSDTLRLGGPEVQNPDVVQRRFDAMRASLLGPDSSFSWADQARMDGLLHLELIAARRGRMLLSATPALRRFLA